MFKTVNVWYCLGMERRQEIIASTPEAMARKVQEAREQGWTPLSCQGRHVRGEHAGMLVTVAIR